METMKDNVDQLTRLTTNLEAAREELDQLNLEENLLEWEPTAFPVLQQMFQMKEPYDKLWKTALNFHVKSDEWLTGRSLSKN